MQSTIEKTFTVDAPLDQVWAFLRDPNRVVTCVPGARITEQVDDRTYRGAVSLKIGPVVTDFQGDVTIERIDEEAHVLELKGQGRDTKGKGSADLRMTGRLQALDGGGTAVTSTMQVRVVGRLAQFGARLFEDISSRMFDQFATTFTGRLTAAPDLPAAPTPVKAIPLVGQALWSTLTRSVRRPDDDPAGAP